MGKGDQTRTLILKEAIEMASLVGLENLTIGKLASTLNMSKSGLFAHFSSKENLQVQIVNHLMAIYHEKIVKPAFSRPR